jgi:cytidine deaminase
MVMAGEREIDRVAVYTAHTHAAAPCGICRQVLREFGKKITVISETQSGERSSWSLEELLPNAFGPSDLGVK